MKRWRKMLRSADTPRDASVKAADGQPRLAAVSSTPVDEPRAVPDVTSADGAWDMVIDLDDNDDAAVPCLEPAAAVSPACVSLRGHVPVNKPAHDVLPARSASDATGTEWDLPRLGLSPSNPTGDLWSFNTQRIVSSMLLGTDRYTLLRSLGSGVSGSVQLAIDNSKGTKVAIKMMDRGSDRDPCSLAQELLNHRTMGAHPHIIGLKDAFLAPSHVVIVMEYAGHGDMSTKLEKVCNETGAGMPEAMARRVFQQLMTAVDYCHQLGIANRDIKLDNILLHREPDAKEVAVKLCDFGWSRRQLLSEVEFGGICKTACGTPEYIPPEVLGCCAAGTKYSGLKADIWSCGVALYCMLHGDFPFVSASDKARLSSTRTMQLQFKRILTASFDVDSTLVSPEAEDLLRRMIHVDPAARLSAAEVLAHPWTQRNLDPELAAVNERLLRMQRVSLDANYMLCDTSAQELRRVAADSCWVDADRVRMHTGRFNSTVSYSHLPSVTASQRTVPDFDQRTRARRSLSAPSIERMRA